WCRPRYAGQHADALPVNITKQGRRDRGHICFDGNNQRFTLSLTVAKKEQPQEDYNLRFRDQDIVFAHSAKEQGKGPSKGQNFEIPTANPLNYSHVISNPAGLPSLSIDGKLFLPPSDHRK